MGVVVFIVQDKVLENWFNLDLFEGVLGVSIEKVYQELFKGKKGQEVVVAVIDFGVDYEYEDFDDVMWVNVDEIFGNGKDDDNNGYVDDIYGWNFLGNKSGENIEYDNLEVICLYKKYGEMFKGKDFEDFFKKEKVFFVKYEEYKKVVEDKQKSLEENVGIYVVIVEVLDKFEKEVGKKEIFVEDLDGLDIFDLMVGYVV